MHPEHWSRTEQLLALNADRLAWANWQRAGGKGRKPKPIPRPGVGKRDRKFGGKRTYTPAELHAQMARFDREAVHVEVLEEVA